MSFFCPECDGLSLTITVALFLPADARSDDIALQLIQCEQCSFQGAAVYEASRRGATETWHHDGYYLESGTLTQLQQTLRLCPHPQKVTCNCLAHQQLGETDPRGRWVAPPALQRPPSFQMVRGGHK